VVEIVTSVVGQATLPEIAAVMVALEEVVEAPVVVVSAAIDPKEAWMFAMAEDQRNAINATGQATLPENVEWTKIVATNVTNSAILPKNVIKILIQVSMVLATTAKSLATYSATALKQAAGRATDVARMVTWPVTALRTVELTSANATAVEVLDISQGSAQA
jgi:hypothetical protein